MEFHNVRQRQERYGASQLFSSGNYQMPAGPQQNLNTYPVSAGNMIMPVQQQQQLQQQFQQQYHQQLALMGFQLNGPQMIGMSQQDNLFDWGMSQPYPNPSGPVPQMGYQAPSDLQVFGGAQFNNSPDIIVNQMAANMGQSTDLAAGLGPVDFSTIDAAMALGAATDYTGLGLDNDDQSTADSEAFQKTVDAIMQTLSAAENNYRNNEVSQLQGVQQDQQVQQQLKYQTLELEAGVVPQTAPPQPASQLTLPIREATHRPASVSQVAPGLTLPARPSPVQPTQQHVGVEPLIAGSHTSISAASPAVQTPSTDPNINGSSNDNNNNSNNLDQLDLSDEEAGSATKSGRRSKRSPTAKRQQKRTCQGGSCVECKKSKTKCECAHPQRGTNGTAACRRCAAKNLVCVWDATDARSRRTLSGDVDTLAARTLALHAAICRVYEIVDRADEEPRPLVQTFLLKGYEPEHIMDTLKTLEFSTKLRDLRPYLERKAAVRAAAYNENGNLPGFRAAKNRLKKSMLAARQAYHERVKGYAAHLEEGRADAVTQSTSSPTSAPHPLTITQSGSTGLTAPTGGEGSPAEPIALDPAIGHWDGIQPAPQTALSQASQSQEEQPDHYVAGFAALAAFTHASTTPTAAAASQAVPGQGPSESNKWEFEPMAVDDDDLFGDRDFAADQGDNIEEDFLAALARNQAALE